MSNPYEPRLGILPAIPDRKPYDPKRDPALNHGGHKPVDNYVAPLTAEQINSMSAEDMRWLAVTVGSGAISQPGYDDECGMMPDEDWRQVRAHMWTIAAIDEACSLIPESPITMFGVALKMELDMMAAIWQFEDYGLDDPIATPKIAPAKMTAPDVLPYHDDVYDVLEKQSRKTPITPEYRTLVDIALDTYVPKANGHPIRITADNYIKRENTEVRMYCRYLEGDDRDGVLVGVALNEDDPARPVCKGAEILGYLELCHKAGIEFRKSMVGPSPKMPPFKCQRTGNPLKATQSVKTIPAGLSELTTA